MFFLQNSTLIWHTDNPDLTLCFQRTALVWIPCTFLWLLCWIQIYFYAHNKERNVPWNFLTISKLALTALLCLLCVADLAKALHLSTDDSQAVSSVSYYTPLILLATFVSISILLCVHLYGS